MEGHGTAIPPQEAFWFIAGIQSNAARVFDRINSAADQYNAGHDSEPMRVRATRLEDQAKRGHYVTIDMMGKFRGIGTWHES